MPAIVLSQGEIVSANVGWSPAVSHRRVRLYGAHYYTYSRLYREQPNVRTCVDFLARNVAQLGLHVFRRMARRTVSGCAITDWRGSSSGRIHSRRDTGSSRA